ncbi:hypothetical protein, partial [Mesorhizobium sp.]|uniref:hypothetical protein n=1 Tax=Mesorhizobium sp. TaxID=1871066 RepID=UPI0025E0105E
MIFTQAPLRYVNFRQPPHPAASRPPSPRRGEEKDANAGVSLFSPRGEKLWGGGEGCGTIVAVKLEWSAP